MNKKHAILAIAAIIILGGGIYLAKAGNSNTNPQTKEQAIRQAQNYKPENGCTDVIVPAIHNETGAKYTFPSGCLAPGWVPEQ